jgi:hypothetical protein
VSFTVSHCYGGDSEALTNESARTVVEDVKKTADAISESKMSLIIELTEIERNSSNASTNIEDANDDGSDEEEENSVLEPFRDRKGDDDDEATAEAMMITYI